MTTGIGAAGVSGLADVTGTADELVRGLTAWPLGRVSASVYETGRLVTLSPWLGGHVERLRFLLASQRTDGAWVSPLPAYALIPTLSATEALLATLRKPDPQAHPGVSRTELAKAAREGVAILSRWLDGTRPLELPDMPAVEHIAPVLIKMINRHLRYEGVRLQPPSGLDGATAEKVRALLTRGVQVPQKLFHALEIGQEAAHGAPSVRPEPTGSIGASPAATAAWIGEQGPDDPDGLAPRFLEAVARQHGGPVPSVIPITNFERAWVLSWLIGGGIRVTVPQVLIDELRSALGPRGTSGGSGLPTDADTSAGMLYALSLLGAPHPPDLLWAYETETHFCTWQGENGRSVTTNAHVLEAFGHYLESTGGRESTGRYQATVAKVSSWLCAQQGDDGGWRDRWHASPYYATVCAALALHRFGGEASAPAVERAVRWVLGTQRPDGSWGRWSGTAEETAYALQVLVLTEGEDGEETTRAVTRGGGYLRSVAESALESSNPPLWHDKELYCPIAVVRAAILAALHLTRRNVLA